MSKNIFKRPTITFIIFMLVLNMSFNTSLVQAAPSTFTQTSWAGGQTTNTANHTSNQSGWSEFSGGDARILNTTDLQLNNSQSTNINFNTESDYIQENAATGTDFDNGDVTLYKTDLVASGGNQTYTYGNHVVKVFKSSGTFTVSSPGKVDYLIVAGGGSAGDGDDNDGGGGAGGAGGLILKTSQNITNGSHAVVVGAGGAVTFNTGAKGDNSSFRGYTSIGGGGGAYADQNGLAGGSGGGGSRYYNPGGAAQQPGSASGGYGYAGGRAYNARAAAGGGGGAGSVGKIPTSINVGGVGGSGRNYSSYFGTGVGESGYFASGGGGGGNGSATRTGTSPLGGGGGGGTSWNGPAGQANTGGGGGGGDGDSGTKRAGGAGGSGVVIVRYLAAPTYPISSYYVTTNNNSQKDTSNWQSIQEVNITQTTPTNTNIKHLVSFDGRTTWKYYNGSSWQTSTLSNIETNGMTKTSIEALTNSEWSQTFTQGTFDIASSISTTDATVTPQLDNIEVNYTTELTQSLTSNSYNTEESLNTINNISWNETLPSNTDIKFQIRTSPDNSNWTDWLGPNGSGTYFTDPTGNEDIDGTQTNGVDDQYFQYKVTLSSTDGLNTSTLSDVSIQYEKLGDVIIPDPDNTQMQETVDNGYITLENGTITATTQTQTQVQVTFQSNTTNAIFPANTTMTAGSNFNFENFITQNTISEEQGEHPNAIGAVRLGVPNTNLTFNQNITVEIQVSSAYNEMELEVLSQLEGSSTWNPHTTCTVTNNICSFTTNHATTYIVNGDGTISGSEEIDINVEVQETLSLDCYDKAGVSGDFTVTLGTGTNPGVVIAGIPAVGQSTCNVTTNDDQGYYLSVINDNTTTSSTLTHTVDSYEIPDLTLWDESAMATQSWNAPTTKGLGFSVITFPQADTTHNTFDGIWTTTGDLCEEGTTSDDAEYAGLPETAEAITAVTAYTATQTTTDICYKVDVSPSQPSGTYEGSVTYTATSDANSYYQ